MSTPPPNVLNDLKNNLWTKDVQHNTTDERLKNTSLFSTLNKEQMEAYEAVMDSVENKRGKLFFLYGPGGTGKTYVYKTIISKLRSFERVVLPVASSGIAAQLLPGGRTTHSMFKIPLNLTEESMCAINRGTILSELFARTDLIIWDEAPVSLKHTFEVVDRTLRDILSESDASAKDRPFGGKTVLLGGDFRQTLLVTLQGTRADTVLASISQSYLWNECEILLLQKNMRLQQSETKFASWLLSVGDGTVETSRTATQDVDVEGQLITVENNDFLRGSANPLHIIAETSLSTLQSPNLDGRKFTDNAILTPRNDTVDEINEYILAQVPGEVKEYLSADSFDKSETKGEDYETLYPLEYLNSLEYPGLPKHKLRLKPGVPVMLLRNINLREGLCNGTRLIITKLGERVLEGQVVTGTNIGEKVLIPRIVLSPTKTTNLFTLRRRQFPIRVCYAMMINKSQGQNLKQVLLYLLKPVFSHGQLYVALSKVTTPQGLHILQPEDDTTKMSRTSSTKKSTTDYRKHMYVSTITSTNKINTE